MRMALQAVVGAAGALGLGRQKAGYRRGDVVAHGYLLACGAPHQVGAAVARAAHGPSPPGTGRPKPEV